MVTNVFRSDFYVFILFSCIYFKRVFGNYFLSKKNFISSVRSLVRSSVCLFGFPYIFEIFALSLKRKFVFFLLFAVATALMFAKLTRKTNCKLSPNRFYINKITLEKYGKYFQTIFN